MLLRDSVPFAEQILTLAFKTQVPYLLPTNPAPLFILLNWLLILLLQIVLKI
jgi:hypothetical protein